MRIILLVIFILFFKDGFANSISLNKDLYAIHYGLQNGLPTTNVYDLAQDENGFLYLGTGKGLFRYDGFSFKSMNENIDNYMGGSSVSIYNKDNVFFESFDGYVYQFHQKKWKSFNINKPVHFLKYGIHKDTLFVVQKKGLDIYSITESKLLKTVKFSVGSPQYTHQVGANFYMINENYLIKANSRSIVKTVSLKQRSSIKNIRQIYHHQNKIYIIGRSSYKEKVWVYDLNLNYQYSIDVDEIKGLVQHIDFIDGKVWISTNKGIFVYENLNTNWKFEETLFVGDNISRILRGKNNEYWISVIGKGLYMVPNTKQFVYSFPNERITRFICDTTGYLTGTNLGNIYQLKESLSSANFVLQNPMQTPINYLYKNSSIHDLFYVPSLGFHHIHKSQDNFYDLALKSVADIDNKYYAFATSSHLLLYPKHTINSANSSLWDTFYNKLKDYNSFANLMDGLRSKAVCYDSVTHKIYALTNVGLFMIDINGHKKELLVNNNPIIADVMALSEQNLFYLTYSGDVYLYNDGSSKKLEISSRVLDFKLLGSSLVLKTENGFIIYDVYKKSFKYVSFKCDPSIISDFSLNNKNLIILMTSGIIEVPLETDIKNNDFPKFILENIVIGDKLFYNSNIPNSLPHDINSLEINFAILDYTYSASYTLYYRINKGDWKALSSNLRTLQFHQLSSGRYDIEFKINDTLIDSNVHFEIQPPYWETWWFYLITSLSIVTILSYYFRNRRKKLQTQIKLLEEKIQLEKQLGQSLLTSIKAQMNPHFYFNALNSIQAFIYKNDREHAIEYLSKFSKLTRKILMQTEAEDILLEEEIDMLRLYLDLEKVRFSDRFSYSINYSSKIDRNNISIPAMLIQPYVENAVKHGFNKLTINGLIKILFETYDDYLKVTVEDNGVGRVKASAFKKETEEASFSSGANKKRLEILNANAGKKLSVKYEDILNSDGEINGTRVILFIPIIKQAT